MAWNKTRQQMESFLCPALIGRVEYKQTGYRYQRDKTIQCCLVVDKAEVFRMDAALVKWYQTEQEIKNDPQICVVVTPVETDQVRATSNGTIPEERLSIIVKNRKLTDCAKAIYSAQTALFKTDFASAANAFLSLSIDDCLESNDILLNVFALVDRRIGKKRLQGLQQQMRMRHPAVQYFYDLRCSTF